MSTQQLRVTFQPSGRSVFVLYGTKMLEAAGRAGLTIQTPCGGGGTCGKCRVRVVSGACDATPTEQQGLSADELAAGWRLACQTRVCSQTVVDVPDSSLFASQQRILTDSAAARGELRPAVRKRYVELSEPSLADCDSDLERLQGAVGPFKADLSLIRRVGRLLRRNGFKGTAVLTDNTLIDFEPGDTTGACYGVAFDIGTTTLAATLLDLCGGSELAVASRMNPQVSFGDDVLSRIQHASNSPENLEQLRECIANAIDGLIEELCLQASVPRQSVYEIALAGNTTMQHLLCGLDVAQLGAVPFVPVHQRGLLLPAAELAAAIHHSGRAYVFPLIGGFVGGDTVAGMLAAGLGEADGPTLMIDIGTNGEIVLAHEGTIRAASTAAGPAFEGARISRGMRATRGAVEKVVFNETDIELGVIGNVEPIGICGSALVDLAAGLLETGIVSTSGRLLPPDELPAGLGESLRSRVRAGDSGQGEFVLAETGGGPLALTQRDIRELQLASGAIRAGISILLREAGLSAGDLQHVLIAGGFGSFIRRDHAQRIGLLPGEVDHRRISYIGNASLAGARWALLSTDARKRAEQLARTAKHVQLSEDPEFQMEFAEAMIFPERRRQ